MTLPTLTWTRRTTSWVIAGATPTQSEIIDKLVAFIGTSTFWKVTASVKDTPAAGQGYIEIAPVSATAGITEMRFLLTYSSEVTPSALGASNRVAPYASVTSATRFWVGGSPNAATTGPNANPWTSKAYTSAGWAGMTPLNSGGSIAAPVNASELGMIESNEILCLYWFYGSNIITGFIGGNMLEAPDGNSAAFGFTTNMGQSQVPTSSAAEHWFRASSNNSAGSTSIGKALTVDSSSTIVAMSRTQFDGVGSQVGAGYTMNTYAILMPILIAGGPWAAGDSDVGRGFARQMRWGPAAWNGQVMTDGTTQQAICLNYHQSLAKVAGIWFDQQR